MKLHTLFPDGLFSPAASPEKIGEVEAALLVKFPDELSNLLLECDGFREPTGNAKYLLSLTDEDSIGSILGVTKFMWSREIVPDLTSYVFFGCSSADEFWGICVNKPYDIIAYHHGMGGECEAIGDDILSVYQNDYRQYEVMF